MIINLCTWKHKTIPRRVGMKSKMWVHLLGGYQGSIQQCVTSCSVARQIYDKYNKYIFKWRMHVCVQSHFGRVWLYATLGTVVYQAPLSIEFCWQQYCSGLPCPPPGDLPDPEIKTTYLMSSALAGRIFTTSATREAQWRIIIFKYLNKINII